MAIRCTRREFTAAGAAALLWTSAQSAPAAAAAGLLIPGTGPRLARTGDDFEAEDWAFYPQLPKSSYEQDKNQRLPGAYSKNELWVEGAKRGTPDFVKKVKTPPGGIEGSTGAMQMQTLHSGVPGRYAGKLMQDDLLHNVIGRYGSTVPTSWSPNVVARVYIPAGKDWEMRYGISFGYRIGLLGNGRGKTDEEYWPGFFFEQKYDLKNNEKHYFVKTIVRGNHLGHDLAGPLFEAASWVTLGMSCTPDGLVQFYARAGVEDLRPEDHLGTYPCYLFRAHTFQTFFFDVMNEDDGRSLSSPWIVDNCYLHVATAPVSRAAANGAPRR
jgi:hypothetical protein